MSNLVPFLSAFLPVVASLLLVFVIVINLYIKIRRNFPKTVNCWFCNTWTKVPYDDRNSFYCPTCSQYNGFTKDGDYNKIIPEQHDELMNNVTQKTKAAPVSNGLCVFCNNNQRLKVRQLANFVPLVEENYDIEIEHFQEQLEKAYKLCKKCDKTLKKTLDKQTAWIFGNRVKDMCRNGASKIVQQVKQQSRLALLSKVDGFISILLVASIIVTTLFRNKFISQTIGEHLPRNYTTVYNSLIAGLTSSKTVNFSLFAPYFTRDVKLETYSSLCTLGFMCQFGKCIYGNFTPTKTNQLLSWIILILTSWVRSSKSYSIYVYFTEGFCCLYLIATAFTKDSPSESPKPSYKQMRRLVRNLEYTCSDVTDSDLSSSSISVPLQHTANSTSTNCEELNKSFTSTRSTNFDRTFGTAANFDVNKSLHNQDLNTSTNLDGTFGAAFDLNKSLHNLNLGFKAPSARPRPVLSPPKLQSVNSWLADGYYNDVNRTNSRASSESSGFGSQHEAAFSCYDFGRMSPPAPARTFYPNLQQNNMLLIHRVASPSLIRFNEPMRFENWSDKIKAQSFGDLAVRSNKDFVI